MFSKNFLFLFANMSYLLNDIKSTNEIQINKCRLFGKDHIGIKNSTWTYFLIFHY